MLKISVFRNLLVLWSLGLLFTACNNDDDEAAPSIVGTWEISSATFNPPVVGNDGNTYTDAKPIILDFLLEGECDADNLLIMNEDNSLSMDEGSVKCNPDDPQQSPAGTWTLNGTSLSLTLTGTLFPVVVSDLVITETTASGTIQAPFEGNFVPIDVVLTRR